MDPRTPIEQQQCRDVVGAYRQDQRMPPALRQAAWARLQAEIAAEAEPEPVRRGDRRRDLWWGVALAAAAALVLLFAAQGRSPGREAAGDAGSQAAHEGVKAGSEQVPIEGQTRAGAASEAAPVNGEPPPVVTRPRSRLKSPELRAPAATASGVSSSEKEMIQNGGTASTLNAELALLRAARDAIGRGAPAEALAPLKAHAREFSTGGHLIEERLLLNAQALCELGEVEAARKAGEELVRLFPASPNARTIAGHCDD